MNQVTPESKSAAIKTLAILGFIVMIVVAVWVAVQIVRLIPAAFTTLADLAGEVNQNGIDITLNEETLITNTGETVTIAWNGTSRDGEYAFSYDCMDGVSVAFLHEDDSKEFIPCGEPVVISNDDPLRIVVSSEKQRSIELAYAIIFTPESGAVPFSASGKVTVFNPSIPVGGIATNDEEKDNEKPAITPAKPSTPAKPVAGKPVTTITYVTEIPKSDPKGFTDLAISFVSSRDLEAEDDATFKIEVKNLGTKTSQEFNIDIELPNGDDYEIENEEGLKPNERATYTIEFDATDLEGKETIEAKVSVSDDKTSSNNSFRATVEIDD